MSGIAEFLNVTSGSESIGSAMHSASNIISTIRGDKDKQVKDQTIKKVTKIAQTVSHSASLISSTTKAGNCFIADIPSVAEHTSSILGPVVAISALVNHSIVLAVRSGRALQIKAELEKIPDGPGQRWERNILEALSEHATGMVVSSAVGVTADTVGVVGSFVPGIGSIPASAVGGSVAILRVIGEYRLDSNLKEKLEKITEDYRIANPKMIENSSDFRASHQGLMDRYDQAKTAKEEAEKAYHDVLVACEKTSGSEKMSEASLQSIAEASAKFSKAQEALNKITATLKKYENDKANLDAYEEALNLIRDFEPKVDTEEERELESVKAMRQSTYTSPEALPFTETSSTFSMPVETPSKTTTTLKTPEKEKAKLDPRKEPLNLKRDVVPKTPKIDTEHERELDVFKSMQLSTLSSPEAFAFG